MNQTSANPRMIEGGLFLTYDSEKKTDGLGAQAQRVIGIFGVAKYLEVGYFHSPIYSIESNPGEPNYSEAERNVLLSRINRIIDLSPSFQPSRFDSVYEFSRLGNRELRRIRDLSRVAAKSGTLVLTKIGAPYPIVDKIPSLYLCGAEFVAQQLRNQIEIDSNRIDVHIRRAVSPRSMLNGRKYVRHVSTDWYSTVLDQVVARYGAHGLTPKIRIHTDIPSRPWKPDSSVTAATMESWKQVVGFDSDGFLESSGLDDLERLFDRFGEVEVAQDWDPIEAIVSMVSAGTLVTCASSFSFLAGLLRGERNVVAPIFWHTAPPNWITLSEKPSRREKSKFNQNILINLRV